MVPNYGELNVKAQLNWFIYMHESANMYVKQKTMNAAVLGDCRRYPIHIAATKKVLN